MCSTITTAEKTNTFADEEWKGHWIQVNDVCDWLVGLWTWLLWCFRTKWKGVQASLKHPNCGSALAGRRGSGPALWREGLPPRRTRLGGPLTLKGDLTLGPLGQAAQVQRQRLRAESWFGHRPCPEDRARPRSRQQSWGSQSRWGARVRILEGQEES